MKRKKWTPKTEVTEAVTQFREKRKWQIALRRYILERGKSSQYAPFFGLDVQNFRRWIEIQFSDNMNWANFSTFWQLDHIVPVTYFDFSQEKELMLCWNFTNITVEATHLNRNKGAGIDALGTKRYFELLFSKTKYWVCEEMIRKIEAIELATLPETTKQVQFVVENREFINALSTFDEREFSRLNDGVDLKVILDERAFINRILR